MYVYEIVFLKRRCTYFFKKYGDFGLARPGHIQKDIWLMDSVFLKDIATKNKKKQIILRLNWTWNCRLNNEKNEIEPTTKSIWQMIHRITKKTANCTLLITHIFSVVFHASNVCNPKHQSLQRLERLLSSCSKSINCLSNFGEKNTLNFHSQTPIASQV